MNRTPESYRKNNPVGFVYFNSPVSNRSGPSDTSDFIAFNNSQSPHSPFNPTNVSSPNGRYCRRNRFNRNFNRFQNSYRQDSVESPNNSYGSNNYRSPQENTQHRPKYDKQMYNKRDLYKYYDRTMTENPWEVLEKEFAKRMEEENDENESVNDAVDALLASAVGGDSDPRDDNSDSDDIS